MSPRRARMPAPERWLRVGAYFVALVAVCLAWEAWGRVWGLWTTRPGSPERVRRCNLVMRTWGQVLTRLTFSVLGARLDVAGAIPPGRFVVVSNHQSTADIAILIWALAPLECRFVAKEELGRWLPAVSMALRHFGSALIAREGSREDLARMKAMASDLALWNASAIIFAESTRSRDGSLLPYKAAAVRIVAKESGLPILPIAIDGTHVASDLPGFARDMPGAVGRITIGAPIAPEQWRGRLDEVVEDVRLWTHEIIERGRATGAVPPPPGWTPGRALDTPAAETA